MSFYAVRKGFGGAHIYKTWDECKNATNGFSGAIFKKFETLDEAKEFAYREENSRPDSDYDVAIYTDGSFVDGRAGSINGFAAIFVIGGAVVGTLCGPSSKPDYLRNVGGEIEAAEQAIRKALELGFKSIKIYHDYEGVGAWPDETWSRNRIETIEYHDFVVDARKKIKIDFVKIAGHKGNRFNELADSYAKAGARASEIRETGFNNIPHRKRADKPEKADNAAKQSRLQSKASYVCPECGAPIDADAVACMSCGVVFDDKQRPVEVEEKKPQSKKQTRRTARKAHVCAQCGAKIKNGEPVYKVLLIGKKFDETYADCCCLECAKNLRDNELVRLSELFDKVAGQDFVAG